MAKADSMRTMVGKFYGKENEIVTVNYAGMSYDVNPPRRDDEGYIRLDDLEMQDDVQQQVADLWQQVTTENVSELADIAGYRNDFYQLFGFNMPDIDYDADVDQMVQIESLDATA